MVEYLSEDHIIHKFVTPTFTENSEPVSALVKPKISIKKTEEGVVVRFEKNNHPDTLRLFSKRSNEDDFELLSEVSDSSYLDTRPNTFNAPELREYMAYYVKDNAKIGESSDIVLIIKK